MRKIYYVPGLISAILIPVLFWYYGSQKAEEINISVIDIGLPAKIRDNNEMSYITFEPLRNWDYKKINIASGAAKENSKLYVSELKNLQKRNEKETGIEFILDQNNTYGDFVSLLNDMSIAKHGTYALDIEKTGHLFAIVEYEDPNRTDPEFECLLCNDNISITEEAYDPNLFDKMQQIYTDIPKDVYYFIFGFLLFLNISMLSIKENLQLIPKKLA
ncbi:hypothetical protein C1637_23605 [Chryseobacterium lactis]|uniref:Uncharacterized protein n=1 Tax=Chryseobacterium lactis TaxID=1241981 RepID=A0A3G6RDS9_CHRLC|nr:hypothetical protein [Chryseobacterium lactis]AZA82820.1 hypothetical protein EG342_13470 [Chryseobacterium lactis]AZB03202.1 hypothetical protein EG341_04335 [Chryseobacterium lactis]PNW11271.1 hypothetical protein C1637_23605 [Chryseobacterium lactis]